MINEFVTVDGSEPIDEQRLTEMRNEADKLYISLVSKCIKELKKEQENNG